MILRCICRDYTVITSWYYINWNKEFHWTAATLGDASRPKPSSFAASLMASATPVKAPSLSIYTRFNIYNYLGWNALSQIDHPAKARLRGSRSDKTESGLLSGLSREASTKRRSGIGRSSISLQLLGPSQWPTESPCKALTPYSFVQHIIVAVIHYVFLCWCHIQFNSFIYLSNINEQ